MRKISRKKLAIGAFMGTSALCAISSPAYAQFAPPTDVPPVQSKVDQFNVDLVTRNIAAQTYGSISVGPSGPGGLKYVWTSSNRAGSDLDSALDISGSSYSVYIAGATTKFTLNGTLGTGTFTNNQANGATLSYNSSTGDYTYTTSNGTVLVLGTTLPGVSLPTSYPLPKTLTYPAGETLTWWYRQSGTNPDGIHSYVQETSVTSNLGYQFRPVWGAGQTWSKIQLFNMANETCDPQAASCTLSGSWPTIDFSAGTVNGNPVASWSTQANSQTGGTTVTLTDPITSTQNETITYQEDSNGRVTSVTDGNGVWTYSWPSQYGGVTYKYTGNGSASDPSRQTEVLPWDTTTGLVTGDILLVNNGTTTADSRTYSYDSYQRVTSVVHNKVTTTYTYDGNGNVTHTVTTDTNNANPITTSAVYPSSGCNTKTCNQPSSTTDANGNVTTYTYDPNSGGPATITYPAVTVPNVGSVHPTVTTTYSTVSETWKNGSGGSVTGSAVYRPHTISRCMTQATCSSTTNPNDQVLTTIAYDTSNGLQPSSSTTGSNNSASPVLQATTAYTYTAQGDLQTVDGPLPGTADTTWSTYDLNRRMTGQIGPLPGNGQPMRAVKVAYTIGGEIDTKSVGTASAQSAAALNSMTVLKKTQTQYNSQGLPTQDTLYDNTGVVAGINQYSYTPERMLQCTAVRNNSGTWTSQSDACTQTATNTDLITKTTYDDTGNVLTVRKGYTSDTQVPDTINTWYSPGQLNTQKDGNGNTTTYSYDTFNRLSSTCYPDSGTDCAKITLYDANGNVKTLINRAGQTISLSYDALNRLISKTLPEFTPNYTYDLLGHVLSASQPGYTLTFTYDALGRQTKDGQGWGAITRTFDLAGRLTQVNWWDGFYVNYDRLTTGEISQVRENGATTGVGVLATYAYDALGNRSSLTFGNGSVETYGYDSLYRLQTFANNLSGTANDLTRTFGYNPAAQITSAASTNSAYAWTGAVNVNRSYTPNSLNQYASVAGKTFSYDANGNLTGDGTNSYSYTSENILKAATVGGVSSTLYYDPLGRLTEYDNSTSTRFQYDGPQVAAELNGSTNAITNRFVWGDNSDELLVWYQGSDTSNRRFVSSDERGSVISATDSSGNLVGINTYDEYGIPGSANIGRFQYTGQMYLPEIGMYNYKARFYSTTLGRFMQTDPIGYGDGMNWYAYAQSNPISGRDSSGTQCVWDDGSFDSMDGSDSVTNSGDCSDAGGTWIPQRYFDALNISPDAWTTPDSGMSWWDGGTLDISPDIYLYPEDGFATYDLWQQAHPAYCSSMLWQVGNTVTKISDAGKYLSTKGMEVGGVMALLGAPLDGVGATPGLGVMAYSGRAYTVSSFGSAGGDILKGFAGDQNAATRGWGGMISAGTMALMPATGLPRGIEGAADKSTDAVTDMFAPQSPGC